MDTESTYPTQDGSQGNSPVIADIASLLAEVKELRGQVSALQSGKDKGVAKTAKETKRLNDEISTLRQQIAEWEQYRSRFPQDADVDQIAGQFEREKFISSLMQERSSAGKVANDEVATPQSNSLSVDVKNLVSSLGLNPADPKVNEIAGSDDDFTEVVTALAQYATQQKQTRQPSQAAFTPAAGAQGNAQSSDATRFLNEMYAAQMKNVRRGDANGQMRAIKAVRDKAKEMGVKSPI